MQGIECLTSMNWGNVLGEKKQSLLMLENTF